MGAGEFDLIRRWFTRAPRHPGVILGVGDDGALLAPEAGRELAVTTDALVAGVHFFPDADPEALGHKALAVNLSDLAAMGAEPRWFTLALSLPASDEAWLTAFARGLWTLAEYAGIDLVGGDTTRAPQVVVTVTAAGVVPAGLALRRAGARPGDRIYCSGDLGGAALAVRARLAGRTPPPAAAARLDRPTPRLELGRHLRGLASACIDCSDGLAADLGHVLSTSGVGARVRLSDLPLHADLAALPETEAWDLALGGGDDYELIFTVPPARGDELRTRLAALDVPVRPIGVITAAPGLVLEAPDGRPYTVARTGHVHF